MGNEVEKIGVKLEVRGRGKYASHSEQGGKVLLNYTRRWSQDIANRKSKRVIGIITLT